MTLKTLRYFLTVFLILSSSVAMARSAAEFYEDAIESFGKKEYRAAIIDAKNALQKDPRHLPSTILLGKSHVALGDGAAAELALDEARALGAARAITAVPRAEAQLLQFKHKMFLATEQPADLPREIQQEIAMLRARAAIEIDDKKQLANALKDAEELAPNAAELLAIKSMIAMRDGDLGDAEELAEKAIKMDSHSTDAWLAMASVRHVRRDADGALQGYDKILQLDPENYSVRVSRVGLLLDLNRDDETGDDLAFLDEHNPIDPRVHYLRSVKLARAGDYEGSVAELSRAINVINVLEDSALMGNPQVLLVAGVAHYSLQNDGLATRFLTRLIELGDKTTGPRRMLAIVLMRQGNFVRAISLLEPLVKVTPDPSLMVLLSDAYQGAGQHRKATDVLQRARELDAKNPAITTRIAVSQLQGGQRQAAIEELAAVFLDPSFTDQTAKPLALMYLQAKEYRNASKVADKVLNREPDNIEFLNIKGIAAVGLKEATTAREQFTRVLAIDASNPAALMNLAKLDRQVGNLESATKKLKALLAQSPEDPKVLLDLGRVAEARGDVPGAIEHVRESLENDSNSFETAETLVRLLLLNGNADEAMKLAELQETKYSENLYAQLLGVRTRMVIGDTGPVRGQLRRMVDLAHDDVEWLLRIARVQDEISAPNDAAYTLTKLVQIDPENLAAQYYLAELEIALGRLKIASDRARTLKTKFPNASEGHEISALLSFVDGDIPSGISELREALRVAPKNRVILDLASALVQSGDVLAAIEQMNAWLAKYPGDRAVEVALADLYLETGKVAEARSIYERLAIRFPNHALIVNNLAHTVYASDRTAAIEHAKRAVGLAPDNPQINDTLGWMLVETGELDLGLKYLREAQARATDPEIQYHLSVALGRLGRTNEARAELERALASEQAFKGRSDAEQLLQEWGG